MKLGSTNGRVRRAAGDQNALALLRRLKMMDRSLGSCLTVGVTSCMPGEGSSTVALRLAATAASHGDCPVLLVDVNASQRGSVTRHLRLQPVDNADAEDPRDSIQPVSNDGNLRVFSWTDAGQQVADYSATLDEIRSGHDMIVVDLPNANELTPCAAIARMLDGVILVVEAERVALDKVERACRYLHQSGVEVLGVVYNKQREYLPRWLRKRL